MKTKLIFVILLFVFHANGSNAAPTEKNPDSDQIREKRGVKTGSTSGCDYSNCDKTNYASYGQLNIRDDGVDSTFGGKAGTYTTPFGTGASADIHIAHVTKDTDWAGMELNAGKIGAGAHIGLDGVGAKVDATLAEAGGKIGKGPLSIGGKVGLSADTGFQIGPKTEVKLLGTGVSLDHEDGASICLFGSCLSLG